MFCNQKTNRLGPQRLTNKAATRVKKTTIATGSPERIMIEDSDEVNVPEGSKDPHRKKNCFGGGAVMSSDQAKKKQASVIELSSDSASIEIKAENEDKLDLCANSVEFKYDQATTSRKRKLKTTFSSRKAKRTTADESGEELPCIKTSKGKQVARVTGKKRRTHRIPTSPLLIDISSDEESAPHQGPGQGTALVQCKEPSPKQRNQRSATVASTQPSDSMDNTRPPAEAQLHPTSIEDPSLSDTSCPAPSIICGTYTHSHICISCN